MHSLAFIGHFVIMIVGVLAVFWLPRQRALQGGPLPSLGILILAIGIVALGVVVLELVIFRASSPPDRFWDFLMVYYPAGQAVLDHDPGMLRALIGKGVSGFVNMP